MTLQGRESGISAAGGPAGTRAAAGLGGAFAGWTGELAALLPAPLRRAFGLESDPLVVELEGERLRLRPPGGAPVETELAAPDRARVLKRAGVGERDLVLRLPGERRLVRSVELPRAAETELAQVLALELDRQTPFRAEQVYFGHAVESRGERSLKVRLWVVPREVADARLQRLAAADLRPDRVEAAAGEPLALPGLAERRGGIGAANRLLVLLLVGLFAAWAVLPQWLAERRLAGLQAERAAAAPALAEVRALAEERQRLTGGAAEAVRLKAEAPSPVRILEELSRLLPDDTFLGQFNVVDGRVEIEGATASASALVPILEGSPLFAKVTYRAPVSAEPVTKRERFQFVLELRR